MAVHALQNVMVKKRFGHIHKQKYITLKHLLIEGKKQIGLQFSQDRMLEAICKSLDEINWSDEFSMFYLRNTKSNLGFVFKVFKGIAWVNLSFFFPNRAIKKGNNNLNIKYFRKRELVNGRKTVPEEFLQKLELRKYAFNTAKVYVSCFEAFINFYSETVLEDLSEKDIHAYLQHLVNEGKSDSYINQSINAIKFYYEVVLGMPNRFYSVDRPKKKEALPRVLSKQDVLSIISNTNNIKHKCIVSMLYSSGIRRGELINLKLEDVESKRMMLFIQSAKGGKDRYTLLSESLLKDLRVYYRRFKPKQYLFEGPSGGQYSASSKATEIYTHVAKHSIKGIKSPLD